MKDPNDILNVSAIFRRISGTTYKLKVHFSETAKETMEDKILRMIRNESKTLDFSNDLCYNGVTTNEPPCLKGIQG